MDTNPEMEVTSDADVEDMLAAKFEQAEKTAKPEAKEEAETEEVSDDQTEESEETEADDDSEDMEFDGETYKVPKKIREAVLRQQDYTKKTQEVAEQRRQVEETAKFLQVQAQIQQAQFEKAVEVRQLANQAQEYEKLDWQALAQQDPAQAMALQMQYQTLQRSLQAKAQELQGIGHQAQQLTAQQRQTLAAKGGEAIKSKLPNWGPELQSAIAKNIKGYGYSESEIAEVYDPRLVEMAHDAMQWKKLQASKPAIAKKTSAAKPLVKATGRSFEKSQDASRVKDLQARARKSGRPDDVEAHLEALIAQRKRK